jgi:predicted transcriptional regulator
MTKLFTEKTLKRDRIQLLADILKASEKKSNMSRIMRLANVQYYTWGKCIEKLSEKKFIEIIEDDMSDNSNEKMLFKATKKGLAWTKKVETVYDEIDHR